MTFTLQGAPAWRVSLVVIGMTSSCCRALRKMALAPAGSKLRRRLEEAVMSGVAAQEDARGSAASWI
jgi:hypothetical protein